MIEALISAVGAILVKLLDKLTFKRNDTLPKQTLKLVLQPHGAWWHMGAAGAEGKPAMQIVCDWHATNITSEKIIVTTAFIKRPRTEVAIPLVRHPHENIFGNYPIMPNSTSDLSLDFWIQAPVCKEGMPFKAMILVKDQFDNEHKIKDVVFEYR